MIDRGIIPTRFELITFNGVMIPSGFHGNTKYVHHPHFWFLSFKENSISQSFTVDVVACQQSSNAATILNLPFGVTFKHVWDWMYGAVLRDAPYA